MHIKSLSILNIRGISDFSMQFKEGEEAGWHVLIGDNGSGKSTVVQCIALALIGPERALGLREVWGEWVKQGAEKGTITIRVDRHEEVDQITTAGKTPPEEEMSRGTFELIKDQEAPHSSNVAAPKRYFWGDTKKGWFSAGYGPMRRFSGGNPEKERLFRSVPKAGAHLSLFGEDVALTEAANFVIDYYIEGLANKALAYRIDTLKHFVNHSKLLPKGMTLERVTKDTIFFTDANGNELNILQLSEGYRSMLSLTFELIRQLIETFDFDKVFPQQQNISSPEGAPTRSLAIDIPGVVLIDEIDTHLHPTWQTRIGQWFTSVFPNIQFIVTTHSPLICRIPKQGSIWRLAVPGTQEESGEVTGTAKDRLVFGNVLDAFGTTAFGSQVAQSNQGLEKRERLAALSQKSFKGTIRPDEQQEMELLKAQMPTA